MSLLFSSLFFCFVVGFCFHSLFSLSSSPFPFGPMLRRRRWFYAELWLCPKCAAYKVVAEAKHVSHLTRIKFYLSAFECLFPCLSLSPVHPLSLNLCFSLIWFHCCHDVHSFANLRRLNEVSLSSSRVHVCVNKNVTNNYRQSTARWIHIICSMFSSCRDLTSPIHSHMELICLFPSRSRVLFRCLFPFFRFCVCEDDLLVSCLIEQTNLRDMLVHTSTTTHTSICNEMTNHYSIHIQRRRTCAPIYGGASEPNHVQIQIHQPDIHTDAYVYLCRRLYIVNSKVMRALRV